MLYIYFFSLYPVPPKTSLIPSTRLRLIWRVLIDIVNSIHCAIDMTRYTYIIIRVLLNQSTKITQHLLNYLTPNPNYTISPLFLLTQSLYRKIVHSHKLVCVIPSPLPYVDTEPLITAIQQGVDHVFWPSRTFILV